MQSSLAISGTIQTELEMS